MSLLLEKAIDGTIRKYLDIEGVENINFNEPQKLFYQVAGGEKFYVEDDSLTLEELTDLAQIIAVNNGINWRHDKDPLSAKLPDGTRVEVFKSADIPSGFSMSLRKRQHNRFSFQDFGLSASDEKQLKKDVETRKNIIVSGGTSSGKTTFLEMLCKFIPHSIRLITIQDPVEIEFDQPDRLDLTVTSSDIETRSQKLNSICMTAMRQNPDSLIFGEIREKTMAYTYRTASNTGHDGCMATIHANNARGAMQRLADLVHAYEGGDKASIYSQLFDCIDIVVQLKKGQGGKRAAMITHLKDIKE